METERIALSQRERDRLRVLHEVKQKQITQIEAARRLKVSDRHIRRLLFPLFPWRINAAFSFLRFGSLAQYSLRRRETSRLEVVQLLDLRSPRSCRCRRHAQVREQPRGPEVFRG
jgi:hypothetical protein